MATLYTTLTNDTSATNTTLASTLLNTAYRDILYSFDWTFLYATNTATTTTANTQTYTVPADMDHLISVTITSGSYSYTALPISDPLVWRLLNQTPYYSSIVQFYQLNNTSISFWPTPSTSALVISYYYKKTVSDLSGVDVPIIPAAHHVDIVYRAVADYYLSIKEESRADRYINMYEKGLMNMKQRYAALDTSPVLVGNLPIENPNNYPML